MDVIALNFHGKSIFAGKFVSYSENYIARRVLVVKINYALEIFRKIRYFRFIH